MKRGREEGREGGMKERRVKRKKKQERSKKGRKNLNLYHGLARRQNKWQIQLFGLRKLKLKNSKMNMFSSPFIFTPF